MKVSTPDDRSREPTSHQGSVSKFVHLRRGAVPHVMQLAQAHFPPGAVAGAHAHADMTEVFVVQSGTGEFTVQGTSVRAEPGTSVTIEAGEVHEVRNPGTTELVLLYFGIQVPPADA